MCAFLQHRQPDNTIMEADPKYSRSLEQDKETLLSDICIPFPFPQQDLQEAGHRTRSSSISASVSPRNPILPHSRP